MWRDAWFIASNDARYLLMKRETILWTFVMPIIFFYFIGTVTGGYGGGGRGRPAVALEAPAGGFLAGEVGRRLDEAGFAVVPAGAGATSGRAARRLVLPPAFTDSVLAGHATVVRFGRRTSGMDGQYDEVRVRRSLYTVLADLVAADAPDGRPDSSAFARMRALPRPVQLKVSSAGQRRDPPVGFQQAVPGTLVMFTLLVLLTSGAVLLIIERREGLLRRLASTPMSRTSIVLGKWIGRMMLGLVQVAFGVLAGTLLFRMQWGPDIAMVALVLVFWAALTASLGLLIGGLCATEGQAVGIGVFGTNLLAALGGCWWPIEVTPQWMQTLSLALPTGWTMDALHRLITFQAGPASVLPHLAALALAALVAGWAAVRTLRFVA